MKGRDPRVFVADMITAAGDVATAVAGLSEAAFLADRRLQKATIRDLEVIGEAARNLAPAVRRLAPRIPWRKVVAMRNRLIHGYFDVDLRIVYHTASRDVPALLPLLRDLLGRLEAAAGETDGLSP
jgi:uncharacterized protein with HEPN domain